MKYGAITGIALIAIQLLFYYTTGKFNSTETLVGTASWIIFAVSLFYFSRQYRNEFSPQYFSYGSAFRVSLLTGLFASIIVSFFFYLFCKLKPEVIKQFLLEYQKLFEERGIDENDIEVIINALQRLMSAGFATFNYMFGQAFLSVIVSLIVAIVVKRRNTGDNSGMSQFERDMSKIK
jgi:hypothetical protein